MSAGSQGEFFEITFEVNERSWADTSEVCRRRIDGLRGHSNQAESVRRCPRKDLSPSNKV